MATIELQEIERIVQVKKGKDSFTLFVHEPSAGVLLAVHEVQVKQNKNQKALNETLSAIEKETDEAKKQELSEKYQALESEATKTAYEFIKCMVSNYDEVENDLKYMNINYLGQVVQAVQAEFSKTADSKKKLVSLSKKSSGESNSEKLAI